MQRPLLLGQPPHGRGEREWTGRADQRTGGRPDIRMDRCTDEWTVESTKLRRIARVTAISFQTSFLFSSLSLSVSLPLFFSTLFLRWITQAAKSNSERPILETNSRIEARTFRRETNVFLFFFQPDIFIRARR